MPKDFGRSDSKSFYPMGVLTIAYLFLGYPFGVQAQSLQPVCVGIPSSSAVKQQRSCCSHQGQEQCVKWEQLFPDDQFQPKTTLPNDKSSKPFMQVEKLPKPFDPNKPRSENAAKDAVIQMGIDQVWSFIEQRSGVFKTDKPDKKSKKLKSSKQQKPNFFQRVQQDYNHFFGPHPLGKDKTIEPRLDLGLILNNDITIDSAKAGVKIKF